MRTTFRFPLALVLLAAVSLGAGVAQAAEPFDAAARAEAIAPFLDEQTIVVVHVDLTRIEVDPLLDKIGELIPEAKYDLDKSRAETNECRGAFLQCGFSDVYVVVSLADVPQGPPFVILPMTDESDFDALLEAWPRLKANVEGKIKNELVQLLEGAMFFGPRSALERIQRNQPHARPELEAAFQAAGDTAVQLLLLPSDNDRRVITELMPELPKEIGGGPSTILTRGLLWVAVGLNTPPKISASLTIQSEDNAAAVAFRGKLVTSLGALAGWADAKDSLRDFQAAVALLTPQVQGDQLTLQLNEENQGVAALLTAVTPPLEEARRQAARSRGMNNLKQIALAMHNWYDTYKSFPAVANHDANGNPLLSWRVHILPFIDENKLYKEFHLDEPWDSDHNKTLVPRIPEVYRSPASKKGSQGYASYVLPVHEGTAFPGQRGIQFKDITDGTSNTIMVVEVGDEAAVIWTKPEDLDFDPDNPAQGLGGLVNNGFQCAFCDGSAHFMPLPIEPEALRYLFLRADGHPVSRRDGKWTAH